MTLDKEEFKNLVMLNVAEDDRVALIHDLCAVTEDDKKCSMLLEEQMAHWMRRVLE